MRSVVSMVANCDRMARWTCSPLKASQPERGVR